MRVTCEECLTEYNIPDDKVTSKGMKVRCTNCGHIWTQYPEGQEPEDSTSEDIPDDTSNEQQSDPFGDDFTPAETDDDVDETLEGQNPDSEDEFEDIPEGVKPERGLSTTKNKPEKEEKTPSTPANVVMRNALANGGAVALSMLVVFLVFFVLHTPLTKAMPFMIGFYNTLGIQTVEPGEDLIFEKVESYKSVHPEGGKALAVEGRILNLGEKISYVPDIEAKIIFHEEIVGSWVIKPEKRYLEPREELIFLSYFSGEVIDNLAGKSDGTEAVRLHMIPSYVLKHNDKKAAKIKHKEANKTAEASSETEADHSDESEDQGHDQAL